MLGILMQRAFSYHPLFGLYSGCSHKWMDFGVKLRLFIHTTAADESFYITGEKS